MESSEQSGALPGIVPPKNRRWRRWALSGLVALVLLGWFLSGRGQTEARVTILPPDHVVTAMQGPVFDRLIPARWTWLWKLRRAVFGGPASVDVTHTSVHFSSEGEALVSEIFRDRAPLASSNGISAWVISREEASAFADRFGRAKPVSVRKGRVSLGAGVVATISSSLGPSVSSLTIPPGYSSSYAVRPRAAGVEIRASFVSWDVRPDTGVESTDVVTVASTVTNLQMAASMLVPDGMVVYLHSAGRDGAQDSGTGVLIEASVK